MITNPKTVSVLKLDLNSYNLRSKPPHLFTALSPFILCLQVEAAKAPEFEEVRIDATDLLGGDAEDLLINVAPKKANWDLRRDVATKLAVLDRRTQTAMVKLMAQEEQARMAEAGGIQD